MSKVVAHSSNNSSIKNELHVLCHVSYKFSLLTSEGNYASDSLGNGLFSDNDKTAYVTGLEHMAEHLTHKKGEK